MKIQLSIMLLLCGIALSCNTIQQVTGGGGKTSTVVATGTGSNEEQARRQAEINAIISTIGSFVSQETTVMNDKLIQDKISEISSGTITKSEIIKPFDGKSITIRASVSVSEVMSFCKKNGIGTTVNGTGIYNEIARMGDNQDGEETALQALSTKVRALLKQSFDYRVIASDPSFEKNENNRGNQRISSKNNITIPIKVEVYSNANIKMVFDEIKKTFRGISMNKSERDMYTKLGNRFYEVTILSEYEFDKEPLASPSYYYRKPANSIRIYVMNGNGSSKDIVKNDNNTFYIRLDPSNWCNTFSADIEKSLKAFTVIVGADNRIDAGSFRQTVESYITSFGGNNSQNKELILPDRKGVLSGVFSMDYSISIDQVKNLKKVEVIPTNGNSSDD